MPSSTVVDVLGVVHSCEAPYKLQLRNGTDAQKRSLILKDTSNKTVEVCLLTTLVQHVSGLSPSLR